MSFKVLFVGSNPSATAKTYNPFCMSTKSGIILNTWIATVQQSGAGIGVMFCNVSDNPTQANKPLNTKEITENLPRLQNKINQMSPHKIVALGKTAEKALTLLDMPHLAMPHPSGLNRKLNDPEYVAQKIKELREYLSSLS